MWLDDAVVYEIYMRSFNDTDGDGVGDLAGVAEKLPYLNALGVDAVWLTPIYPSPNADYGYDVSDYTGVHPQFGTLDDLDHLVAQTHARGMKVVLDFVPCHSSTEHPWFRSHPDYYVWADEPANNWVASFGGPAWQRDPETGRFYLHSFFPEQADLNWRNPEVREQMTAALRFWLERGVDGFRLDALDRLLKDPRLRDDPPATRAPRLPLNEQFDRLEHVNSGNAPDIGSALRAIRGAVGDETALIGEVYLPTDELGPYLETLDIAFAFEAMQASGGADALRAGIAGALATGKQGWVLSNHDFSRLGSRFGAENARAATLLMLSLPGPAFLFQGDELGMLDRRAGGSGQLDRAGRDRFRSPMPWDDSPDGGFTTGSPWLPVGDGATPSAESQLADANSHLSLTRRLIDLRRSIDGSVRFEDSAPGTIVLSRGEHIVAVNLSDEERPVPRGSELVAEARPGDGATPGSLPPHGGVIAFGD